MFLTGGDASTRSRGIDDKYLSAALEAASPHEEWPFAIDENGVCWR
jgi:hypothetical protein